MGSVPIEPAHWTGQWIWSPRPALGGPTPAQPYGSLDPSAFDQRVLFRRTFDLAAVPFEADLWITADARYAVHVNGVGVGTGPVRHGPRQLSFDDYDVRDRLRPGRNVIAVLARFYGHPVPWWEPSPPSLTMGGGGLVAELRLDDEVIGTDADWRHQCPTAWQPGTPPGMLLSQLPETLDARLLDPQWTQPEFDDSDWAPAHVLAEFSVIGPRGRTRPPTEPWGALIPRPIPPLTGKTHTAEIVTRRPCAAGGAEPRSGLAAVLGAGGLAPAGDQVLLIADFGQVVSGRLTIELDAPAGTVLDGAMVEVPTAAAVDSSPVFRYLARGHDDVYRTADPVGGRYVVLLLPAAAAAGVRAVRVREALRPRVAVAAFSSNDHRLDEIYRVGLRTVDLTAHDAYIDCPTREQRAWTGDAVVHQSVDLVANQDWSLARWNPRLLAQPRVDGLLPMVVAGDFATTQVPTVPDWSLHWIRSVHNLYRYTGDQQLVAGLLGTVEGVLRWFERYVGANDLIGPVPGWVLIDWSPVQVAGTSAALNALVARGLKDFAEMARWLGDHGRADWADAFHARLRSGFGAFWDTGRAAYRDNLVNGARGTGVSEHVAAAAICGDLVPTYRYPKVLRLLTDRAAMFTDSPLADHGGDAKGPVAGTPVSVRGEPDWDTETLVVAAQPFFRYVVHDALALLDAADEIATLCLDWVSLLAQAPTAFRECWEGGSYCHGWSATPVRDLIRYTLGISPGEPGYRLVRVAPRLGHLDHASGAAPTPFGVVTVAVDGDQVRIESPVPVEVVTRAGARERHEAGRISTRI